MSESRYQKLGGWLLWVVIGNSLGLIYLLIQNVSLYRQAIFVAQHLAAYQASAGLVSVFVWLSAVIVTIATALAATIIVLIFIRNPYFFKCFELMFIFSIVSSIGIILFSGAVYRALGIAWQPSNFVMGPLQQIVSFAVWSTYFRKSFRVRTYMGNGAYMKKSIFFRRAKTPWPSDEELELLRQQQETARQRAQELTEIQKSSKKCPACGEILSADTLFCHSCGCNLEEYKRSIEKERQKKFEEKGLAVLFEDKAFADEANLRRRVYGKAEYISYIKWHAKELGLGEIELSEEDVE